MKITPREKRRHAACRLFSLGVIFSRAGVSLALLSLRKNGGLLVVYITLGARDFSSAVSGFCQVFIVSRRCIGLRPTPKFPPHARKTSDTQGSNPSKYQVLVMSRAQYKVRKVVRIDGHTIRQTQEMKLLGVIQSSIVFGCHVFWMSRNVPPKERREHCVTSKKTAARETSKTGVFCRALNRQRVGASQK